MSGYRSTSEMGVRPAQCHCCSHLGAHGTVKMGRRYRAARTGAAIKPEMRAHSLSQPMRAIAARSTPRLVPTRMPARNHRPPVPAKAHCATICEAMVDSRLRDGPLIPAQPCAVRDQSRRRIRSLAPNNDSGRRRSGRIRPRAGNGPATCDSALSCAPFLAPRVLAPA